MIKIDKQAPPASFTTYKQSTTPIPSFSDMDKEVKAELRESLLNEQGWLCAYCSQKISHISKTKIEHHCEQSICNGDNGTKDRRLDYTNMLAVCLGQSGIHEKHCDTSKSTFNSSNGLPIDINPLQAPHIAGISYSSTGLINSSNPVHDKEIKEILKLNSQRLKDLRAQKFLLIMKLLGGDLQLKRQKKKLEKILKDDLIRSKNKFSNSFPGMSLWMMRYCQ